MGRWVLLFASALALVTLALVGPPEQAHKKQSQRQVDQNQAIGPVFEPTADAQKRQGAADSCPGSYHPELKCDAISANADEDQARNAENQTWWFRWEVGLTFGTLIVAAAAMEFARQAAKHNRRSADAAEQADRPHFLLDEMALNLGAPDLEGKFDFTYKFTNYGRGPGWVKAIAISIAEAPEIMPAPEVNYEVRNLPVAPKGWYGTTGGPMKVFIEADTVAKVVAGELKMIVFVALQYRGAGGDAHEHRLAQLYLHERGEFRPTEHVFSTYT